MADLITIKFVRIHDDARFVLGGYTNWKFQKKGLDGFGEFENDLNYVDNGIHDGGLITSNRIASADRSIKASYINPAENEEIRQRTTAFFNAKSEFKCYITYMGKTLWGRCYINKFNLSMAAGLSRLDLTLALTFPNPYLNSNDDFGADIAAKTPMIAFPYLVSADRHPRGLTGGVFQFDNKVEIDNGGDVETYCKAVFTANAEVINPSLHIGDNFVRVLDTLVAGDVVEMDFTVLPPTVKKNGVNYIGHCDRASSFTSMTIPVGKTEISYAADDGSNNLSVSLYYNELFTSI